jgi:hypothetical protein
MWNEADGGGGYIWLLYITVPIGLLWFFSITIVSLITRSVRSAS